MLNGLGFVAKCVWSLTWSSVIELGPDWVAALVHFTHTNFAGLAGVVWSSWSAHSLCEAAVTVGYNRAGGFHQISVFYVYDNMAMCKYDHIYSNETITINATFVHMICNDICNSWTKINYIKFV